jgi:uncharacterized protein YraI
MTSYPLPAGLRLRHVVATLVMLTVLASPPAAVHVLAQSPLSPGTAALIANTGGDPILLRETPSFDAAVLSSFYEGTPADVLEGPVYDATGVAWYGVSIGGVTGYIVGGFLSESTAAPAAAPAPVELAQEAVSGEPVTAEPLPAPAASLAEVPANPIATADLNLRAGPSYDDAVLLVIPAGAALTPTGEFSQGFAGVTYEGSSGWVDTSWLGSDTAPQPQPQSQPEETVLVQNAAPDAATTIAAPDTATLIGDLSAAPAGTVATAVDVVNLRAGPSYADTVLRVIPPGGAVTITGGVSNGWAPVWYNGTWGYVSTEFLASQPASSASLAQEAAPASPAAAPAPESGALQATALSDVNLRAAPDLNSSVLTTIPPGTALSPLAGPEAGFYQVQYGGQTGWAAAEFLEVSASYLQRGDRDNRQNGKVEGSEPASNAEAELGAGGIIWPVSGGLWYIMQGYNGSSHQNQDGLWQYYYSLDLARRDGETAGQQVISPVNGVVRWTDPGSGGISIDIGNGHAVAMYHVTFMDGLEAGTPVRQGQYLGTISGPGGPGFAGTPHLHFTLWQSDDNGNWDRQAVPFAGPYAISGMDFPDIGGGQQHAGTEFSP